MREKVLNMQGYSTNRVLVYGLDLRQEGEEYPQLRREPLQTLSASAASPSSKAYGGDCAEPGARLSSTTRRGDIHKDRLLQESSMVNTSCGREAYSLARGPTIS